MSDKGNSSTVCVSRRAFVLAALTVGAPTTHMSLASSPAFGEANPHDFCRRIFQIGGEFDAKVGDLWSAFSPEHPVGGHVDDENPWALGGKRSFVPPLGKVLWELPKSLAAAVPFSARIYEVSKGRPIGYVRVPHFEYDEIAANEFGNLMDQFDSKITMLILDQVNNPGGSMIQMYAMLAHLTDRVLSVPKHQMMLNEDDEATAYRNLSEANAGESISPELVAYSRFVLSEIEAGRGYGKISNPGYLMGIPEILPCKYAYTKSIIVLINELDFSAAEFLAAILQDNKRATLFGERTPGAGGCVKHFLPPHSEEFGIKDVTLTWTIAWRTNGQPIQWKGITPDVHYSLTEEDVRSGCAGYRRALLKTIGA